MLFEGHTAFFTSSSTTNGTSGNATFGMTRALPVVRPMAF
jgi:hypothetical protein